MKLFDKYHSKYGCKGHTKENTIFRLIGLIFFVVIWSVLWIIPTNSVPAGITCGIITTIFIDVVAGIGRRSNFFGKP